MATVVDDLFLDVRLPDDVRRVVSLVPSLTETVAASGRELLVGVTDWCSHPADLDVARIRGTKNPDVEAIIALRPDVVLANREENRGTDLDALRAAGLAVYVTDIRTVPAAFASLGRLHAVLGLGRPEWLGEAEAEWSADLPAEAPADLPAVAPAGFPAVAPADGGSADGRPAVVVPIWRRPWMALGSDTFAGDVVERLGYRNVLGDSPERYPKFDPVSLPPIDLVLLPDEPYAFTPDDGPEAFGGTRFACVDGRSLTWYGPSLAGARTRLRLAIRGE
ncbi:helical backbone metal receptor [Cryptosporangium phraense]|uniref:Cobalamin-binding protein n=1 Tax=Cryptosporangium phraense TaxID=2593070 RepID=A0A545AER1_9ACTN|nr:helical backbone metal receptor [Cryptosporangium phraense]TQS39814.1 cobalamin-binding protein [Cryptosporangium phraense]